MNLQVLGVGAFEMVDREEWRTVDGFSVSNLGRLWGKRMNRPILPAKNASGYRIIGRVLLHRLVCRAFHGEPHSPSLTVDHINRDKSDNSEENLRWATNSAQAQNRVSHQRRRSDYIPIEARDGKKRLRFNTANECAIALNLSSRGISKCLVGKLKTHGGYEFRWGLEEDIEGEEWRQLDGIWISDHGRVRNKEGHAYTPKATASDLGYKRTHGRFVHELVLNAFSLSKPEWATSVDHINHDPSDNSLKNLRWADAKLQRSHTRYPRDQCTKNKCKPVSVTRLDGSPVGEFVSSKAASEATGVSRCRISHCINLKAASSGGFRFEWV